MSFLSNKICAVVANYDFSEKATVLKSQLAPFFPTILIDASSPVPPDKADIVIKNTYYPGLWNAAVAYCVTHSFEWLFFIASDVEPTDPELLAFLISEAAADDQIGMYTPSVSSGSRVAFSDLLYRDSNSRRKTTTVEGFCFLGRLDILKNIFPIDAINKSGWGVDVRSSYEAYKQGKFVIADDRIQIFHPEARPEHMIDNHEAAAESLRYLGEDIFEWYKNSQINSQGNNSVIYQSPTTTLDLGCGVAAKNPFNANYVYGIDIVGNPSKRILGSDLNTSGIPFPKNFFNFVTAYDFIEHISRTVYCPDRRFSFVELMNEVYRVICPGGIFLSVTPAIPHPNAFRDPTHVNYITEETFPLYFCRDNLWARMYGFVGDFQIVSQEWDGDKLMTAMRALK